MKYLCRSYSCMYCIPTVHRMKITLMIDLYHPKSWWFSVFRLFLFSIGYGIQKFRRSNAKLDKYGQLFSLFLAIFAPDELQYQLLLLENINNRNEC